VAHYFCYTNKALKRMKGTEMDEERIDFTNDQPRLDAGKYAVDAGNYCNNERNRTRGMIVITDLPEERSFH